MIYKPELGKCRAHVYHNRLQVPQKQSLVLVSAVQTINERQLTWL
jgi:hypothetical protein